MKTRTCFQIIFKRFLVYLASVWQHVHIFKGTDGRQLLSCDCYLLMLGPKLGLERIYFRVVSLRFSVVF